MSQTKKTPSPAASKDAGLQRKSSTLKPVIGTPWKPGQSGNPRGKRRGCVSLTAGLKALLTKEDRDEIIARLIADAKAGDRAARELIFNRLDGSVNQLTFATVNSTTDKNSRPLKDVPIERIRELAYGIVVQGKDTAL